MKAKTQFKKFYYKLPEKARKELMFYIDNTPRSLAACWQEIKNDTALGKMILNNLGFKDE